MSDYLNPSQLQIVQAPLGKILVIAAAGTGKTRVLTERIIHLIDHYGVPPLEIMAITYTNMAAQELKKRISQKIKDPHKTPQALGTIHSIFSEILKRDIEKICPHRKHDFEIVADEDAKWFIKEALRNLRRHSYIHDEQVKKLKAQISIWKADKALGTNTIDPAILEIQEPVFIEYDNVLKKKNFLDFDDILILTTKLLQKHKPIRDYWRKKYTTILIDEAQDLNEMQWRLIKTIIDPNNTNFLIVGDPNQCIFLFSQAKEKIFDEIKSTYDNLLEFHLSKNYRSTSDIVTLSNNIKRIKYFETISHNLDSGHIQRCSMAEAVKKIISSRDYGNWAILFPKNSNAKKIIDKLIQHNIPFKNSRFYLMENETIDKIMGVFRAVLFDNSELLKELLWYKEFNISDSGRKEINNSKNWPHKSNLFSFLMEGEDWKDLHIHSQDLIQLSYLIEGMKKLRAMPQNNLSNLMPHIVEFMFFNTHLSDSKLHKIDLFTTWLKNIQPNPSEESSIDIVMNFESYAKFAKSEIQKKDVDFVTLSTIHKSKGLEWEKIIVLEYKYLLEQSQDDTSNDRHLSYVAVTRAMKELYLVE